MEQPVYKFSRIEISEWARTQSVLLMIIKSEKNYQISEVASSSPAKTHQLLEHISWKNMKILKYVLNQQKQEDEAKSEMKLQLQKRYDN